MKTSLTYKDGILRHHNDSQRQKNVNKRLISKVISHYNTQCLIQDHIHSLRSERDVQHSSPLEM